MGRVPVDLGELVEHWTLLDDEQEMVAGKRGATKLGFALLLKFYTRYGRFPAGRPGATIGTRISGGRPQLVSQVKTAAHRQWGP